jgi:hypothetical protein
MEPTEEQRLQNIEDKKEFERIFGGFAEDNPQKMWKAQLLKPISTTGKNIPTKPKRKDDCNEELKRYAELIKEKGGVAVSLDSTSKGLFGAAGMGGATSKNYASHNEEGEIVGKYWEKIVHYYTKIPEDVACRALEIIKGGVPSFTVEGGYEIRFERKEWHNQGYPESSENSISQISLIIRQRNPKTGRHFPLLVVHLEHKLQLQKVFTDALRREFLDDMDWVRY